MHSLFRHLLLSLQAMIDPFLDKRGLFEYDKILLRIMKINDHLTPPEDEEECSAQEEDNSHGRKG